MHKLYKVFNQVEMMNILIKKYLILNIVTKSLTYLLPFILLKISPNMLDINLSDGMTINFGIGYLQQIMKWFFNLILIVLIYKDMCKLNIKSTTILILTFFSSLSGTIFFFFLLFEKKYYYK